MNLDLTQWLLIGVLALLGVVVVRLNQNRSLEQLQWLEQHLKSNIQDLRLQIQENLGQQSQNLHQQLSQLNQTLHQRLQEISGQVEQRLSKGFDQTQQVFQDVVKRLALIDAAQKRLDDLSGHVIDLQQVLSDKRSRGAWGEAQLNALIRNAIPEKHVRFQYTLSNQKRVDCLLMLPPPTGHLAIDAKFPMEYYQAMHACTQGSHEHKTAQSRFKQMVQQHIQDIASKYIIPGETAEGAVMFLPAEAVFADIHAYFPEVVTQAQQAKVWLASPSTLMAIITTAAAVIRDVETKDQVRHIQTHLRHLHDDFQRFDKRMTNLVRHIDQAQQDVKQIHTSSQKITKRFSLIEQVELDSDALALEDDPTN